MRIYFSGIGGVGIGPLAMIAHDAGYAVYGSDQTDGLITQELSRRHIPFQLDQSGDYLRAVHQQTPLDWFVYTASLPADHPELQLAQQLGLRISKRDELLAQIIHDKQLKLIAVAGTHGKTTTTGMLVWAMKQLGVPVSYSVGSTLSFGPSGAFDPQSEYFVYECDEFDRNFLHFQPYLSLITSVDYDHPDTYPTQADYRAAFRQFAGQSRQLIGWQDQQDIIDHANPRHRLLAAPYQGLTLPGVHNRANASLVIAALQQLQPDSSTNQLLHAMNQFPGTARRFEKLADHLYSDYGHHPVEIAATLQLARELSDYVVLVYQPHQNIRQHEIRHQYTDCMTLAETVYWLPTYLTREDPHLPILTPEQLSQHIVNRSAVQSAELDDQLWQAITAARRAGKLVLCMGAGTIDGWLRQRLAEA